MNKTEASTLLIDQLSKSNAADCVIKLAHLRAAIGDDVDAMREYTVTPYRDDYMAHDCRDGIKDGQLREVRVHRAELLAALTAKPKKTSKDEPAPAAQSGSQSQKETK